MGRREGMIKYVLSLTFPDLPTTLKLGGLSLVSEAEKGNIKKTVILETKVKIKMAQHGGRTESRTQIFMGELLKATTTERRQEGKHREPTS